MATLNYNKMSKEELIKAYELLNIVYEKSNALIVAQDKYIISLGGEKPEELSIPVFEKNKPKNK